MFSKSKSKDRKSKNDDKGEMKVKLAQFGLLDVGDANDEEDDDADLEAELLALTSGRKQIKKAQKAVAPEKLDKMVAECMRDDTIELSDEEDPELLAELNALGPECSDDEDDSSSRQDESSSITGSGSENASIASPTGTREQPASTWSRGRPPPTIIRPSPMMAGTSVIGLLTERIAMYQEAEENTLAAGDSARARRFTRGLKTLNQMLKSSKAGKAINEEDIPPMIITSSSRSNSNQDLSQGKGNDSFQAIPDQSTTIPQSVAFSPATAQQASPTLVPREQFPKLDSPTNQPFSKPMPSIWNDPLSSIPPQPLSIAPSRPPSTPSNCPTNPSPICSQSLTQVTDLQNQYKMAALSAKKTGDQEGAIQCLRVFKQLNPLVQAIQNGQPIDFNSLPPSPATYLEASRTGNIVLSSSNGPSNPTVPAAKEQITPDDVPTSAPSSNGQSPTSVLEALEQRLEKYTQQRDKSKTEDNSRKERMNQRIMKQYQDAIKYHKAGKPVAYDDLPTPPGFPPLPSSAPDVTAPLSAVAAAAPTDQTPVEQAPKVAAPQRPARAAPAVPQNVRNAPKSRVERQLSLLQKRQNLFKEAALEAKRKGEIEQAKEYLRNFKGFDQLILATNSGLPVDMNTVPIPPQESGLSRENSKVLDFEIVDEEDCIMAPPKTDADLSLIYTKLEDDIISQIKMCARTREHFKMIGDVASANRFEQLILNSKKDLDSVRVGFKRGDTPPLFHYESRSFTMIQCNTDITDSDCEVTVLRGLNFNVPNPKELDSFVKIEFPYPADTPPQERTEVVKETNCPEYNHKVVFSVDRKLRALSRVFKRHSVKFTIVCKGRWFHRDTVLGSVKVPLVTLENKCTFHESFDLVDERKKMVGGKLEVKIRLRNPILSKQLEKVTEKWIVIDKF